MWLFLAGVATGVCSTLSYILWLGWKSIKRKDDAALRNFDEAFENAKNAGAYDAERLKRLKERILKAVDIAKQQSTLIGQVDQPSKGASHSRWKNGIIGQLKDLEKQKYDLFREIVADGFDPTLDSVGPSGEIEKRKMSELVTEYDDENLEKEKVTFIDPKKNKPRFTIVKPEKGEE